jgi:predicted transcriptional regulator
MSKLFHVVQISKIVPNGKVIRRRRIKLKIGLNKLAERVKISSTYMSRIEKGDIKYVSKEVAKKIKAFLSSDK